MCFWLFSPYKGFKGNLGAHMPAIQELENMLEDRSLKLCLMAIEAKWDFCATSGNPYFSSIKIVILELMHVMWRAFCMYVLWCHVTNLYDFFCNIPLCSSHTTCGWCRLSSHHQKPSKLYWNKYQNTSNYIKFFVNRIFIPRYDYHLIV